MVGVEIITSGQNSPYQIDRPQSPLSTKKYWTKTVWVRLVMCRKRQQHRNPFVAKQRRIRQMQIIPSVLHYILRQGIWSPFFHKSRNLPFVFPIIMCKASTKMITDTYYDLCCHFYVNSNILFLMFFYIHVQTDLN